MVVRHWWLGFFFCCSSALSFAAPQAAFHPNVIVITLDTTRADRMGFLGSARGLTPNLDAMAQQGVVFSRAYAHVPLTTASHTTIFTGTYPQFNHVNDFLVPSSARSFSIRWMARPRVLIAALMCMTPDFIYGDTGWIATSPSSGVPETSWIML